MFPKFYHFRARIPPRIRVTNLSRFYRRFLCEFSASLTSSLSFNLALGWALSKGTKDPLFHLNWFFSTSFHHCPHPMHIISVHQPKFQNSFPPPFHPHITDHSSLWVNELFFFMFRSSHVSLTNLILTISTFPPNLPSRTLIYKI
jgi:hypothetical protein